eukprot:1149775-Pelagomonas_calceolata.AAC.1
MAAAIAASSALTFVLVIFTVWLIVIGTIIVRVVDSCSYYLSSEVYLAATICATPFLSFSGWPCKMPVTLVELLDMMSAAYQTRAQPCGPELCVRFTKQVICKRGTAEDVGKPRPPTWSQQRRGSIQSKVQDTFTAVLDVLSVASRGDSDKEKLRKRYTPQVLIKERGHPGCKHSDRPPHCHGPGGLIPGPPPSPEAPGEAPSD